MVRTQKIGDKKPIAKAFPFEAQNWDQFEENSMKSSELAVAYVHRHACMLICVWSGDGFDFVVTCCSSGCFVLAILQTRTFTLVSV